MHAPQSGEQHFPPAVDNRGAIGGPRRRAADPDDPIASYDHVLVFPDLSRDGVERDRARTTLGHDLELADALDRRLAAREQGEPIPVAEQRPREHPQLFGATVQTEEELARTIAILTGLDRRVPGRPRTVERELLLHRILVVIVPGRDDGHGDAVVILAVGRAEDGAATPVVELIEDVEDAIGRSPDRLFARLVAAEEDAGEEGVGGDVLGHLGFGSLRPRQHRGEQAGYEQTGDHHHPSSLLAGADDETDCRNCSASSRGG